MIRFFFLDITRKTGEGEAMLMFPHGIMHQTFSNLRHFLALFSVPRCPQCWMP